MKAKSTASKKGVQPVPRVDLVDAARGLAVAMMVVYHFCFDLTYYGWAQWPMLDDARWIAWRSSIVTSFLLVVGVSLALRDARERGTPASAFASRGFVGRWAQIVFAALLVSAGSYALFPQSFIYFGVLHFVAVALWIGRRAPRLGVGAIPLGLVVIALGVFVSSASFDPKAVDWIGFAMHKPITEDYVPVFPWLGVVLMGCGLGSAWGRRGWRAAAPVSSMWSALPGGARRILLWAGRWSLTIYLVHQPVLMVLMGLAKWVVGG